LRQDRRRQVLRRRLAVGAGDRDDAPVPCAFALVGREREQRAPGVRDDDGRRLGDGRVRPLDEEGSSTGVDRRAEEPVSVAALAAQGDEERTRRHVAAIGGDRSDRRVAVLEAATDGLGDLGEWPLDHGATLPTARISSAATARSSNAIVRSASSWYGS
jgi:hypothetical protein